MAPVLRQKNVLLADGVTTIGINVVDIAGDGSAGYAAAYTLVDFAGNEILGEVTGSPTANTLGDRLKTIAADIVAGTVTTNVSGTPSSEFVSTQFSFSDRTKRSKAYLAVTDATEHTLIAAVASVSHDPYAFLFWNAGATAVNVTIRDGTAGTVVAVVSVPAGGTGGFAINPSAPIPAAAVNTNWTVQADGSTTTLNCTALFVVN